MQSHTSEAFAAVKREKNDFTGSTSSFSGDLTCASPTPIELPSSSSDEEEDDNDLQENASNQLVVYDPMANGVAGEIQPIQSQPLTVQRCPPTSNPPSRVLPSVGAFTVQCASCFKWRLIPTKEKYEEIREHILEQPFVCETAREWRPEVSCDDPADISQDGSRLWAIDKPNIAQPPPGWQRLLRIRGEGSTKFADVYYAAPSGKKLRSMVEVQKYLLEHPEYVEEGVTMSQFSFQIPKPLQENYVRKRPPRVTDGTALGMSRPLEPSVVNPLSWVSPDERVGSQLGGHGVSTPYIESSVSDPVSRPAKKQARSASPSKQMYNSNSPYSQHKTKVEPCQPSYGAYDDDDVDDDL